MDAFVDAPSSDVVEVDKKLAEAQTSAKVEELLEAQTSVTNVKESDDAATRAEGVKDGKNPKVIVLSVSNEIDEGKVDIEICPNQVKLEEKHADVLDDVKNAKSNEKKFPKSKTDSERTTSDQATSTKKSRCPGDFTSLSFDLGIDAAFDYVVAVGKKVVISTTDKETSCESVQQIVQKTKAPKTEEVSKKKNFITPAVTKRLPKLSSYVIVIVFNTKEEECVRKECFVSVITEEMSHTPWLKPNTVDLRKLFVHFLEVHGLVAKAAFIKNIKPYRLPMHWRNAKNKRDRGVYVMRHMETYKGNGLVGFLIGLFDKGKAQLNLLRIKYLYVILRSMKNNLVDDVRWLQSNTFTEKDAAKEAIVGKGEAMKEKDEEPKDKNEAEKEKGK
ncbi:hypothetical protein V2J09_016263 [Rumex salicifolius]